MCLIPVELRISLYHLGSMLILLSIFLWSQLRCSFRITCFVLPLIRLFIVSLFSSFLELSRSSLTTGTIYPLQFG
nr:MAG TPA: hypothetical protein [Caudoviricetes sp.]